MVEETPSRMTVGYRILNDEDAELDLSPVVMNNETMDGKISFRNLNSALHRTEECDEDESLMQQLTYSHEPTVLNGLNYLNVAAYLVHFSVNFGVGIWGLNGLLHTQWDITQQHETLVTPIRWCYYIWIPILVFEGVFTLAQLLWEFRARPIVQDGTGFLFFHACLLQTAWTLFFSFNFLVTSFVAVTASLVSLIWLLVRQQRSHGPSCCVEYWLFRFPFFLHAGWTTVMVAVQFSLLFRSTKIHLGMQLAADMAALAILLPVATLCLWSGDRYIGTDFLIPSVIVYSYIGIACRLNHPSQALVDDFGDTVIDAVQLTCYSLAVVVTAIMLPRLLIWTCRRFLTIQVVTMVEDSSYTV